jgi:hypothetical protein
MLIVFTVLFFAGALALNVYAYTVFSDCTLWVNIVTSILLLVVPGIQLLGWN